MAVRLRPDGTLEFDSVEEAVEFQRIQREKRDTGGRPRTEPHERVPRVAGPALAREEDSADYALVFVAEAGKRGVATDELATALRLSNPRGVSGVAQGVRRRIEKRCNGTPVDKLFWSAGKPGEKRWFADANRLREIGMLPAE